MENEQKTTKIRWEKGICRVGKIVPAFICLHGGKIYATVDGYRGDQKIFNTESEARAWVERYLGVEEEKASDTKEWYDAESSYLFRSVDGVITERRLFTEWEPLDAQPTELQPLIEWISDGLFVNRSPMARVWPAQDGTFVAFAVSGATLATFNYVPTKVVAQKWCERVVSGETPNAAAKALFVAQTIYHTGNPPQPTEPKPLIEWIDGEGFVDGVFRATVEESAITHTNAGEKRGKPLFRAFVIREDGVQSKAANCLDELAAKRWCERMILGEG